MGVKPAGPGVSTGRGAPGAGPTPRAVRAERSRRDLSTSSRTPDRSATSPAMAAVATAHWAIVNARRHSGDTAAVLKVIGCAPLHEML